MSWESSQEYYRLLNVGVEQRLGGLHSARTTMTSVDFGELTDLQRADRWDDVARLLAESARGVEAAGADMLLLCSTAFHRVAEEVEAAVGIPFLHLADVVARAARERGMTRVGLVGTSFTMSHDFFTDRMATHGLEVLVPGEQHHAALDRVVYDEVVHGRMLDPSRREVVAVIDELWDAGAQGVVLGCTELEMLVKQADCELPVFPCTTLHVEAALDQALV